MVINTIITCYAHKCSLQNKTLSYFNWVYLLKYFLFHDCTAIKDAIKVAITNTNVKGQNQMDTMPSSIAKPILENKVKVKIIVLTKQIETGVAYFHGVRSTLDLFIKTKGCFSGLNLPITNKNIISARKSAP